MNAALETRIRAAGAEMSKPGRWRVALEQLDQATAQILASAEADVHAAQLALENLQLLYQWSSVMSSQEFHRLNHAVMQLTELIAQASAKQ
jgi:multidrug efflux pump subunit AcrA (membrane-fusion protein)